MLYQTQQPTTQLKKTLLSTKSFNVLFPTRAKKENTSLNKEFKKLKRNNLKTRFAFKAKRLSSCSNLKNPIMLLMKSNALTVIKSILEKLGEEFSELKSGSKNTLDKITARTF